MGFLFSLKLKLTLSPTIQNIILCESSFSPNSTCHFKKETKPSKTIIYEHNIYIFNELSKVFFLKTSHNLLFLLIFSVTHSQSN